jgi:L-alanine-DL-glutamate epimerase-like enolase superfamily enzyme
MKITEVEPIIVDAGWQTWIFVKVTTNENIVGWGECSQPRAPLAVAAAVRDFKSVLTGKDPRNFEMRFWDMERLAIQGWSGVRAMALAGIELALLDIKAKALGISVIELFGGPTRDSVRVYWSHCGTSRASYPQLGKPPISTMDDIANLGKEVVRRGYTALKTNIIFPGDPATVYRNGFRGERGTTDQVVSRTLLNHIDSLIGTFRDAVGPKVDICLDLNFNFKPESCKRIAQVLEQYDLLWLEMDMYNPKAILEVKQSTTTKICTGENLIYMREYLPYFRCRAADVFMIDVPWNGFSQSKKIGDLAQVFEFNVAPHNYYSHLSTFISASLCGVLPNVRIMETDVDALPLKDELVTNVPKIVNGYMEMPTEPGWGTTIVEEVARAHSWQ